MENETQAVEQLVEPKAADPGGLIARRDQHQANLDECRKAELELLQRAQSLRQHINRLEGAVAALNDLIPWDETDPANG